MAVLKSFVRNNPDAVFVRCYPYRTFDEIYADDGFYRGGFEVVADLFEEGQGSHQELLIKPNLTVGKHGDLARDPNYHGGIVTNARFIAGMLDGLLQRGEHNLTVVEGGTGQGVSVYAQTGYFEMMTEVLEWRHGHWPITRENLGVRLQWATKRHFQDYRDDEITWVAVPDGVVHREIPIAAPFRKPGTILINVPTLKTHNLAVTTLCCKAMQGTVAHGYRHFCSPLSAVRFPPYEGRVPLERLHPDFAERIQALDQKHRATGLPHWSDQPDPVYGTGRFECWAQRIGDLLSAFQPFRQHYLLNVVEGIIGRDGTAFQQGKDVPVGLVVAGINPVHVDAVASRLMGHNPEVIPYLVVAKERGLGENNLARIPIYRLPDLAPLSVEDLKAMAVPLPVFLHGNAKQPLLFGWESEMESPACP